MRIIVGLLPVFLVLNMNAQDYTGEYSAQTPAGAASMQLNQDSGGNVVGQFSLAGYVMSLSGFFDGTQVTGLLTSDIEKLGFGVQRQGDAVLVTLVGLDAYGQPNMATAQTIQMSRSGTDDATGAPSAESDVRVVAINRIELSADDLARLERLYSTKIPAGRYWYDTMSGAWGVRSGPTIGWLAAGLQLPGPMPADISGTGTGIFVNGREVHLVDQQVLAMIFGGTVPGRYTLDSQGNLSIEGGMFLANLIQVSQAAQQQKGSGKGGLYSGMGGTVGVDGSGGVMFSTRNASGGYTTYSN